MGGRARTRGGPGVGTWALPQQQRAWVIVFVVGLAGLRLAAVLVLFSSNQSATQVGAVGQATTQSQRLAKSVWQALIGSAAAFPEVKESIDILTRNVRSLKTGEGEVPAAPAALHEQLDGGAVALLARAGLRCPRRCRARLAPVLVVAL